MRTWRDRVVFCVLLTGVAMGVTVAPVPAQDGLTDGAVYALLSPALVLAFTVSRIIFIQQGEFVAYGALSRAAINTGHLPPTTWLVVTPGIAVTLMESAEALLVEQNARAALQSADYGYVPENGSVAVGNEARILLTDRRVMESCLGFGGSHAIGA